MDSELGDMTRELGPSLGPLTAHFAALNRNKRSVALDLKTEGGRRIFYDPADNPPLSVSGAKAMFARGRHATPAIGCDDLGEFVWRARASEDFREGQPAFLEKGTPKFVGR